MLKAIKINNSFTIIMALKIWDNSFLLSLAKEISLVPLKLKPKSTNTVKKTARD